MIEYKRRCKDWLMDFAEWALPISEAPESFVLWTGLFNLSSALRRHVWIPKIDPATGKMLLGSWSVYPNLYILFIAQAGKARKSTTVNYTENFLGHIPEITRSPEMITKEKLLSELVKSPDSSMYIVAPEFGEFIVKSGLDMFGFLTNAYDGKSRLDVGTHTRNVELAESPCVNLIGATTPEWVAANMPESVIGGGFASRVIFISEKKKRRSSLFYDNVDATESEKLKKDLLADIIHIGTSIHGEIGFTTDAKEFMRDWYDSQDKLEDNYGDKLSGYFERKPAHVLKTAICLHFARSDTMALEKSDIEQAIFLIEKTEENLPSVFAGVGKNKYVLDMTNIYEHIKKRGTVSERDLFRAYYHVALPTQMQELIGGLLSAGYIKMVIEAETNNRFYKAIIAGGANGTQSTVLPPVVKVDPVQEPPVP